MRAHAAAQKRSVTLVGYAEVRAPTISRYAEMRASPTMVRWDSGPSIHAAAEYGEHNYTLDPVLHPCAKTKVHGLAVGG